MQKRQIIKNSFLNNNLIKGNKYSLIKEIFEEKKGPFVENYSNLEFMKEDVQFSFVIIFCELFDKEVVNRFSFSMYNSLYKGKKSSALNISDFCTMNNLENKWGSVNNFKGITFEEKLNNLIADFEQFVRNTDLIKVFRGEVWYDQYWINPRDYR